MTDVTALQHPDGWTEPLPTKAAEHMGQHPEVLAPGFKVVPLSRIEISRIRRKIAQIPVITKEKINKTPKIVVRPKSGPDPA